MIVNLTTLDQDQAIEQISQLEPQLFGTSAWSPNAIRQELNAPARTYWADIDPTTTPGNPVIRGYAGIWFDGYDTQIMTIGVAPQHQHHGIGQTLLQQIIDQATADYAERILLEVRVDNTPALTLYTKNGFTRIGLRKRYYQPEGIDAYTMALPLNPHTIGFQPTHA